MEATTLADILILEDPNIVRSGTHRSVPRVEGLFEFSCPFVVYFTLLLCLTLSELLVVVHHAFVIMHYFLLAVTVLDCGVIIHCLNFHRVMQLVKKTILKMLCRKLDVL